MNDTRLRTLAFLLVCWFGTFGVWPFANPDHGDETFIAYLDLSLHAIFTMALWVWVITWVNTWWNERKGYYPGSSDDRWVPLLIAMEDGTGCLRVHDMRTWRNLWRKQYVACLTARSFSGEHFERHSNPTTYAEAVYFARCEYLRMVWVERGMSPTA